ncbi:MAG TPA: hypothetical protein VJN71_01905 [Nitrososphaerales archaeon]|nr:hypothetical protein [Nitrososphaerales archaeon]
MITLGGIISDSYIIQIVYKIYYMAILTVRLSDKERKDLLKYGSVSEGLREGIRLYLRAKKKKEILRRLEELQKKNPVEITSAEIVRMIKEDRSR